MNFSPNGLLVVSASKDREVIVWNAESRALLLRFFGEEKIQTVCFSKNGQFVIYTAKDAVRQMDVSRLTSFHQFYLIIRKLKQGELAVLAKDTGFKKLFYNSSDYGINILEYFLQVNQELSLLVRFLVMARIRLQLSKFQLYYDWLKSSGSK